ncbi:hypothetical protein MTO96_050487, partial [Rhipicephalus appendiculatus]
KDESRSNKVMLAAGVSLAVIIVVILLLIRDKASSAHDVTDVTERDVDPLGADSNVTTEPAPYLGHGAPTTRAKTVTITTGKKKDKESDHGNKEDATSNNEDHDHGKNRKKEHDHGNKEDTTSNNEDHAHGNQRDKECDHGNREDTTSNNEDHAHGKKQGKERDQGNTEDTTSNNEDYA